MTASTPPAKPRQVLLASLIGTTIEFYDFYIYATAAVLVFPILFFPKGDPQIATLQSLATFALAFFARPLGSILFGHFGDRVGRKATLVAALLTMGISTILIGLLPTYASIGIWAPILLALCRIGQGLGLGGEWGGAVLLATENAPPGKRAWYGMFPQLGAPIGFFCSTGLFLLLTHYLSDADFFAWGWRIPFLASTLLVIVGLYARLKLTETPEFARTLEKQERVEVPIVAVLRDYPGRVGLGMIAATATFLLFYLMTVFALSWGTTHLGYTRNEFLQLQLGGVIAFGLTIPLSAWLADRIGITRMMIIASVAMLALGLSFSHLFAAQNSLGVLAFLAIGLGFMGLIYGPLGTLLGNLFPVNVRYTGASIAFNLAGILGASLAPSAATWLASTYGLQSVGYYLALTTLASLIALWAIRHHAQGTHQ